MALDIATSGMSRPWTRRTQQLGFLGFVAFAASLWVWRTELQTDVLAELIIDGTTDFRLNTAITHLSEASAPFFSGKGSTPSYRILRLGRGSSTSKQYLRCYSVIQFSDWREIKMTPVLMDRECTTIDKFSPGDLHVLPQALNLLKAESR